MNDNKRSSSSPLHQSKSHASSFQRIVHRGKTARLVLLDANPLDDISNIKRIDAVILNGNVFPKIALQMMLANVEKAANARMN